MRQEACRDNCASDANLQALSALHTKDILAHTYPPGLDAARLATIREDISSRLWHVNRGMSSENFNGLMDSMALLQLNAERANLNALMGLDRRSDTGDRREPK